MTLPSRQETCRFHLNLQTSTIGQLSDEIKAEDSGIEHVQSYSIQSLMRSPFTIQLNKQQTFLFDPIRNLQVKEQFIREKSIDQVPIEETAVALYQALNITKIYHTKYLELKQEANDLTAQLEPLEKVYFF